MEHHLAHCNFLHHRPFEAVIIVINTIQSTHSCKTQHMSSHLHSSLHNFCAVAFMHPARLSAPSPRVSPEKSELNSPNPSPERIPESGIIDDQ